MKKLTGVLFAALAFNSIASASIIYNLQGTSAGPSAGQTNFTYLAVLSADQQINSSLGANFGVLFDIAGFVSATSTAIAPGISVSTVAESVTANQPINTFVTDSASLMNVRTDITGAFVNGVTPANLYTVVVTTSATASRIGAQTAQALKYAPGDLTNDQLTGNFAPVELPAGVPEPATMGMIGASLLGLGLYRKNRS